jgi:hypothetical protein
MARPKLTPEQRIAAAKVRELLSKQGIKKQLPAMSSRARQAKQKLENKAKQS